MFLVVPDALRAFLIVISVIILADAVSTNFTACNRMSPGSELRSAEFLQPQISRYDTSVVKP